MKTLKTKILTAILCITMLFSAVGFSACTNSDLEAKIAELQANIAEQQTQIADLEQENEELQADIAEQQEQIKALEQEKQELEEEIEYLTYRIEENAVSGTFYSLGEAYEKGFLTQQDLMSIAYYHNGGREGNEDIMPEDYQPKPKSPNSPYNSIKKLIKQTYWNDKFLEYNPDDINVDDVRIVEYLGSYNFCVVVMMSSKGIGYAQVAWEDEVCNVKIKYNDGNSIKIWRWRYEK